MTDFIVVASLVVFGEVFDVSSVDISTACAILMAIVGFMILHEIIKPMNLYKYIIIWICMAGMLFCLIFLRDLFGITGMSMRCIMLFVVFSITTEPILRYLIRLVRQINRLYNKARNALSQNKNNMRKETPEDF